MKKNTILGIVVAVVFCITIGMVFVFLAAKDLKTKRQKESLKNEIKKLHRKLAFTNDPDRNMRKAQEAEGKADWKNALYYYRFLAESLHDTDPRKGFAYYKEAQCYYNLNDYGRARLTLEYGLNHYPDMSQADKALFLMAQIYIKSGEFTNAYKTYNAIIRLFPYRAEEAKQLQQQLPEVTKKLQEEKKNTPRVVPTKP